MQIHGHFLTIATQTSAFARFSSPQCPPPGLEGRSPVVSFHVIQETRVLALITRTGDIAILPLFDDALDVCTLQLSGNAEVTKFLAV
jgi:hypothetical protein